MPYKIPKDGEVTDAIRRVLSRRGVVNSQHKLAGFVRMELKSVDPEYTVNGERVRRLAIGAGFVKVGISARDTPEKTSSGKCPVCGMKMGRLKNLTVYGGSVDIGYRCDRCGYWTGIKSRRPVRYMFSLKD